MLYCISSIAPDHWLHRLSPASPGGLQEPHPWLKGVGQMKQVSSYSSAIFACTHSPLPPVLLPYKPFCSVPLRTVSVGQRLDCWTRTGCVCMCVCPRFKSLPGCEALMKPVTICQLSLPHRVVVRINRCWRTMYTAESSLEERRAASKLNE